MYIICSMRGADTRVDEVSTNEAPRTVQQGIALWMKRLSFLRGALAAVSLLTFLSTLFGWPTWEIARFTHAALVQWRTFASWIGDLLSIIPLLPRLNADVVNYVILLSTVTIPGLYGFFKSTLEPPSARVSISPRALKVVNWIGLVAMAMLSIPASYVFLELLKGPEYLHPAWDSIPGLAPGIVLTQYYLIASFGSVVPFVFCLMELKSYRNGVIFIVGALAVCELVYFSPIIGEQMKLFSDATLGT